MEVWMGLPSARNLSTKCIREIEAGHVATSIGYHDDQLVRMEVAPEQVEQSLSFLRDIRDFLKNGIVRLVGLGAGLASKADTKTVHEFLGALYYEPILVSKSREAFYYADDAPLRSLATNSHGLPGFCTQALLRAAKNQKLLTDDEYENDIITLLRHNYHFVSESHETIVRLTTLEKFLPSELSKMLLARVADPKVDQGSAVRILGDFCCFIWRADLSGAQACRETWLELCLNPMLRVRQPERLFPQFLITVGIRALNHPAVFGGVADWFLRSGRLSKAQHALLLSGVQETMLQMALLARHDYPLWPALRDQWLRMWRVNGVLAQNGWI
jgi:hypothetical protein